MVERGRYFELEDHARGLGLCIMGALRCTMDSSLLPVPAGSPTSALGSTKASDKSASENTRALGPDTADGTLILLGTEPEFWRLFKSSPEYRSPKPDPIDRWSRRVLSKMAKAYHAKVFYPFTGPPFAPFVAWALASGRAFTSPSQMMVHDRHGMMISMRGALYLDEQFDLPPPRLARSPCHDCADRPCLSPCPADALVEGGPYNVAACHNHLDSPEGHSCLTGGCLARLACPLSAGAQRDPDQNAHHMRHFHPVSVTS